MAMNRVPVGQHKSHLAFALLGLVLSAGSVVYWEPLPTLSQKNSPDKITIFLPVYAYLFLLNPLNFYLNLLSSLLLVSDVTFKTGAAKASPSAFLKKHLPWAAHTVSLATLFLSAPLFLHAAVNEGSIDLAIGATLVCVALVTILCSCLKRIFVSRGGFVPIYFSLFLSTGFFISHFPDHNHYEPLAYHTTIHLILLFLSSSILLLSTVLLYVRIGTPTDKQQAPIEADRIIIIVLSLAISVLLVAGYLEAYISVADVAEMTVKAGEP